MSAPYRLRCELVAHEADVRGVAADPNSARIATASRDSLALVWDVANGTGAPVSSLKGHDHFVNAVAFLPNGSVVTASSDSTMRVWSVDESGASTSLMTLKGHEKNVCHIAVLPGTPTRVVSSSWDMTARIWDMDSGECVVVLRGHEAAVWAAYGLPDSRIVTVGGDKTTRVWMGDGSQHIQLPGAHSDVVRAIAPGPREGFVTISNDSSAIFWAPTSSGSFEATAQMRDLHDGSFAYCITGMPSAGGSDGLWTFASGGEDNAIRIMEVNSESGQMSCVQTIMLPGVVWSVDLARNGDVVAGCSDYIARVFTRDPDAVASADVLEAFEKSVSERQLSTKVIGGVDVAKLPLAEEALSKPGIKDGENKMVRTAKGSAEVHLWSASDGKWVKVGDIVDNPDGATSMGGGEVKGKKYDFIFEVELGAGGKKEQLGYNRGENAFTAAQRFIDDNDLNQDFLDQIATFVEQQVPRDALPSSNINTSDPLTGGSRYIPGRANPSSSGNAGPSNAVDPLSGGSGYRVGGTAAARELPLPPPRRYLPHPTGLVTYTSSDQLQKLQSKLAEFNAQLGRQQSDLALNEAEAIVFATVLMPKLKDKSTGQSIVFADEECAVVGKMLKWPTAMSFPVLDLARLIIARPSAGAYFFGKQNGSALDNVLEHLASAEATSAVQIMGCRFLCNLFGNRVVSGSTRSRMEDILKATTDASKSDNRRARETYASLLVNYAVALHSSNADPAERRPLIQTAVALLNGGEKDEEVAFRLAVAMGTLMCGGDVMSAAGVDLGAAGAATVVAPVSARTQQVAHEIATLIAS